MSTSAEAKTFRTYIRTYNNHFAFTSLGVKADANLSKRNNGVYTFRVQGQVYHFLNDLLSESNNAKNLQLYFHDTEHELQNRLACCPRLCELTLEKCINSLQQNPYACFFRNLKELSQLDDYRIILKTIPSQDQRVYNKPTVSQVAALWVEGIENGEEGRRDIQVRTHTNQSRKIEYYFGCYDPLQYPLMFPRGEVGWHQGIPKKNDNQTRKRGRLKNQGSSLICPRNAMNADSLLLSEEAGKNYLVCYLHFITGFANLLTMVSL